MPLAAGTAVAVSCSPAEVEQSAAVVAVAAAAPAGRQAVVAAGPVLADTVAAWLTPAAVRMNWPRHTPADSSQPVARRPQSAAVAAGNDEEQTVTACLDRSA